MNEFAAQIQSTYQHFADRLPEFAVTVVVGLIIVELAILLLGYVLRVVNLSEGLKRILYSLVRAFLWVVLLLVLMQTLGLDNVLLAVTGSGVVVAIFLAPGLTPFVTDVLAGLNLASDKGFQPGARVQVGDKDTAGVIETMDLRKTRVRGKDGRVHVIPNAVIDKNEWVLLEPKRGQALKRRKLAGRLKRKR